MMLVRHKRSDSFYPYGGNTSRDALQRDSNALRYIFVNTFQFPFDLTGLSIEQNEDDVL